MQDALERFGAGSFVYAGEIWNIPDHLLTFADDDPARRTHHERRYVLSFQDDSHGFNPQNPTVLIIPLSSQIQNKRPWEDLLNEDEIPLTRPSIVKLQLIQPISRQHLIDEGERIGAIPEDTLARLQIHFMENLGL